MADVMADDLWMRTYRRMVEVAFTQENLFQYADESELQRALALARAAPDMLKALCIVGGVLAERKALKRDDELRAAFSGVIAAIAKATGQT
jgi:hypothetical protein